MKYDNFKRVENCYKKLAMGTYDRTEVSKCYKLLPEKYKVSEPDKNEYIVAIKAYVEFTIIEALKKLLPNVDTSTAFTPKQVTEEIQDKPDDKIPE